MNNFYSDNKLTKLFKKRPHSSPLFAPMELGWVCPSNESHLIVWSEFNQHVWCYQCGMDYFTLLCPKKRNPFTTQDILERETEVMKSLTAQWSLEKYAKIEQYKPLNPGG
jgi:hypothetical protein